MGFDRPKLPGTKDFFCFMSLKILSPDYVCNRGAIVIYNTTPSKEQWNQRQYDLSTPRLKKKKKKRPIWAVWLFSNKFPGYDLF